eukprot:scaffold70006_cov27-Phaeocystis_antarctica.AAC.1
MSEEADQTSPSRGWWEQPAGNWGGTSESFPGGWRLIRIRLRLKRIWAMEAAATAAAVRAAVGT